MLNNINRNLEIENVNLLSKRWFSKLEVTNNKVTDIVERYRTVSIH